MPACQCGSEGNYALRDWESSEGPFCLDCALEALAGAHESPAPDAGALRVCPLHCERWTWIAAGGRARERRDNPPSWAVDEQTWERAKAAVAPRWDSYRAPWAVVANVYEAMGGRTR